MENIQQNVQQNVLVGFNYDYYFPEIVHQCTPTCSLSCSSLSYYNSAWETPVEISRAQFGVSQSSRTCLEHLLAHLSVK